MDSVCVGCMSVLSGSIIISVCVEWVYIIGVCWVGLYSLCCLRWVYTVSVLSGSISLVSAGWVYTVCVFLGGSIQ